MTSFDFPTLLTWGLPLAAAPLVIHLINLLRHRTVRWGANEFLLASRRKYRTKVILRQLLLLALRVAAIAGIVALFAQPRMSNAIGALLGGPRAMHVILLDDSYSMADSTAGTLDGSNAFARGRGAVVRICQDLAAASGGQGVAVGRFSRLAAGDAADPAAAGSPGNGIGGVPDADGQPPARNLPDAAGPAEAAVPPAERFDIPPQLLTPELLDRLTTLFGSMPPSETAAGPAGAVRSAVAALEGREGSLWIVTDLRRKDWADAGETSELLRRAADAGVPIRFIDSAAEREPEPNLSIESLEPVGGVAAAGVLMPIEVVVRNHGATAIRGVPVEFEEDGIPRPGVVIDSIPAGGTAARRIDVRFAEPGGHSVTARVPRDPVETDNRRFLAVDVAAFREVLVIEEPTGSSALYLTAALDPGPGAQTGIRPRVESRRALSTLDLAVFDCIYLLDPPRLDPEELSALEAFARSGGGVAFFVGPGSDPNFLSGPLYREGQGLFPVPVAGAVDLLPEPAGEPPDLVAEDHPVVQVLAGRRNPLLAAVRIGRYMAVARGFESPDENGPRRLLGLRNGAPLVVEKPYGKGLVVAVLTTAAPQWNTWARGNPSWVVVMLELESHLARGRAAPAAARVGDPISIAVDPGLDEIEVDFLLPDPGDARGIDPRESSAAASPVADGGDSVPPARRGKPAPPGEPGGSVVRATATPQPDGTLAAVLPEARLGGLYAARWQRVDGTERERLVAVNVDPLEGELERAGPERLERALAGIPHRIEQASAFQPDARTLAGSSLVTPLVGLLILLLLAEQALSYLASYHLPSTRRSGREAALHAGRLAR
jgi:hypothetical protein